MIENTLLLLQTIIIAITGTVAKKTKIPSPIETENKNGTSDILPIIRPPISEAA